jgi:hypothetical protein
MASEATDEERSAFLARSGRSIGDLSASLERVTDADQALGVDSEWLYRLALSTNQFSQRICEHYDRARWGHLYRDQ